MAAAALEFCNGPLAEAPHRIGKALFGPFAGLHGARRSTYRIVYLIDDEQAILEVLDIAHRDIQWRRSRHEAGRRDPLDGQPPTCAEDQPIFAHVWLPHSVSWNSWNCGPSSSERMALNIS